MTDIIKTADLLVRQIETGCLSHFAYLIHSNGHTAFVDVLRDVGDYLKFAEEFPGTVKYILETHYHADFVSGFYELAEKTGATIVFGPNANPTFKALEAKHDQLLELGNYHIRVLHTPGHTFESSCFVIEKAQEQIAVITGDTLFLGEVGRPDLAQKGDITEKDLAHMLFNSLKHLKALPDSCLVLPGHGAGSACGKSIEAGKFCDIGKQKVKNQPFHETDEAKFVEMVTTGLPPAPSYFFMDVGLNKKGELPQMEEVITKSFVALTPEVVEEQGKSPHIYVVDIRSGPEFAKEHIPGSIFVPYDGTFSIFTAYFVNPQDGDKIILVTPAGKEKEAITRLSRTGLDCVVGYLEGGIEAWRLQGRPLNQTQVVQYASHDEFVEKTGDGVVIDVRNPGEWESGVFENSKLLNLSALKKTIHTSQEADKTQKRYLHCKLGGRSLLGVCLLEKAGFTNVANIAGGFEKMKEAGVKSKTELPPKSTSL